MKYLRTETWLGEAECSNDALKSSELLEQRLEGHRQALAALGAGADPDARLKLLLDSAYVLLDLERREEAWGVGREVLGAALSGENWLRAVEACDVLFQAEQADSVKALAHGIWLGVTYPVDPELSVAMLQHLVEESPDRSDGAAVAAATARFVVDLRAEGRQREELQFFTGQLLGDVARRHSAVEGQAAFDFWIERLELNDPGTFLPRLSTILDVLVAGDWWFDRDELRSRIPGE